MMFGSPAPLLEMVAAQKQGMARGIPSICSAHPAVLSAACHLARRNGAPLLIETTCNQVNHEGGYSSMTPADFVRFLGEILEQEGIPPQQVILGGDHLGPYPWRKEPAETAMANALEMVRAYVQAGYTKIHLDASMPCADDNPGRPLPLERIARRAAQLCAAAEAAAGAVQPVYVIGSEVPPPGGAQSQEAGLHITTPQEAQTALDAFREAFAQAGLSHVWERVIALVVQPGVEFGVDSVHAYQREAARPLKTFIEGVPGMVYEAHSTDYQTRASLRALVEDHFAILKVGPALTFAYREAVFALEHIERETLSGKGVPLSRLSEVLDKVMRDDPRHWQGYFAGTPAEQALARRYSFSDRIRYYWHLPAAQEAVRRLL
ncbi:class II D-tagatose-bisphosphate aldolase, non-catalytic subunit, partial [Anaerolinea sp.]|uniref:class II D-tagatose-bisphosphate aldolase, non-catalytic subunit n=1 Tax=Anaerolinea sp. TaxID=1872519 RepID=UPI002ACF07C5